MGGWTNCQFIWPGKVYIWQSLGISKTLVVVTMSEQANAVENRQTDHFHRIMTCMWSFNTNSILHGCMFLMNVHK